MTLKRGLIGALELFEWITATRQGPGQPRDVTIVLLEEARNPVRYWIVSNAQPKKWVGPTLAAKGSGEVAMEELVLVAESIDFKSA